MVAIRFRSAFALALVCLLFLSVAAAGQRRTVVSSMKNVRAVSESRGYYLVRSSATEGQIFAGDEAPTQSFEIIRPGGSRVTIGRLFTSCSCVRLESPKTTFERGEPAILTLRNVRPTPPSGQTYALYVQITSPIRATLRIDTFVQSARFAAAEPVVIVESPVEMGDDATLPMASEDDAELVEDQPVETTVDIEMSATSPLVEEAEDHADESMNSRGDVETDEAKTQEGIADDVMDQGDAEGIAAPEPSSGETPTGTDEEPRPDTEAEAEAASADNPEQPSNTASLESKEAPMPIVAEDQGADSGGLSSTTVSLPERKNQEEADTDAKVEQDNGDES